MSECSICCEKFNKSLHLPINCVTCTEDIKACQVCAKKYILDNSCEPSCMICKIDWDIEFINKSFTKKFLNKELKEHREKVLFEKQLVKMPETQEYANNIKTIEKLKNKWIVLNNKKLNLLNEIKKIKTEQQIIESHINNIKYDNNTTKESFIKFIQKCPINECTGFLNEKYKCGICENTICKSCMEVKKEDHKCDEDKKQTISLLKKDTKSCPKCGQLIYKIDGCDQMWCPKCKTAFSWITGKIESGNIHNPEYYRWMRESGQNIPRTLEDEVYEPCRNILPPYIQLLNQVRIYFNTEINCYGRTIDNLHVIKITNIHRIISHIEFLRRNQDLENEKIETIYKDLRAEYLLKKIDKVTFSKKLQIIEKKNKKEIKFYNIWNLLYLQLMEYMNKFMQRYSTIEEGKKEITNILNEANKIKIFVNNSFSRIGKIFNIVYPGLSDDWIHILNMKKYLMKITNN